MVNSLSNINSDYHYVFLLSLLGYDFDNKYQ